jgi:pimeloyl-[acyl-carrier protein] methyl ester esterase
MASSAAKLVLLPGMDGTGRLFVDFVKALPETFKVETVSYPTDRFLSYSELMSIVQSSSPFPEQFVIVAESFSTPLAIQWAATNPKNLKGLVICAGFARNPVRGLQRFICSQFAPLFFLAELPKFATRFLLVGSKASPSLVATVQAAISSVKPKVLSARVRAILASDARADLVRVAVPILYIQATQDRLVDQACLEEIRRIQPQVAVAVIAGPHLLLQREPKLTAEAVAEFVQQLACADNPSLKIQSRTRVDID